MRKVAIVATMLSVMCCYAQYYNNDAQLWFNLYLQKKLTKKFYIHLNQEDRFNNNVSRFELGYADAGITYKLTQNIKILLDYVWAGKKRLNELYLYSHQFYTALVLKKDINHWRFSYRNMLQFQYNNPFTSPYGYFPYYYDRNKFTIKYYLGKRYEFYVAEEIYFPLNNQQLKGADRSRSFIGMFYNLTRHQQIEFYYMFQAQLQYGSWYKQDQTFAYGQLSRDFVFGIGYAFQF